ncbi:hypothetical protein ZL58_14455 [Salmonella enterica subsp. enterica serovar Typhimurium]|nr:hypothetical protein [Salmonella enterica subsp. enterica serovar Typhimurium]
MKTYAILISVVIMALVSGCIGLFIGYNVAENHYQSDRLELVKTQNQALAERDKHINELSARNVELTNQFLDKLDHINVGYKEFADKLRDELKNDIYTQCKLPASGQALLKEHIQKANAHK